MDQESRWYSMFKRLNQNFMKIRITLLPRPGAGRPGQPRPQGGGKDQGGAGSTGHSAPAGERSAGLAAPPPAGHYGLLSPRLHPCDVPQKPSTPQLKTIHQGK